MARTFRVTSPPMRGEDVENWQEWLNRQLRVWRVDYAIGTDGVYGSGTRALTASICHGLGLIAKDAMKDGVTPELRTKLRNKRLSREELERFEQRESWWEAFRRRHAGGDLVAPPLAKILSSAWGWHPPVHDGVDLICQANAPALAICRGTIVRADASGWWGKGAQPSGGHAVSEGDGIIVLRCDVMAGPFRPGLNFCYGHAEHATVRAGDRVNAGEVIGRAGFANAWHLHFMVNARPDDRGLGDRDPMPFVRFAQGVGAR